MRFGSRWLLVGLLCGSANAASAAPQVDVFTPQGTVKQVRQVAVRFSTPMVTLGDPRLPEPFQPACDAKGTARWADARNWVFDFEADVPAGVRCRFTLRKRLTDLTGQALTGDRTFTFDTGGPAIVASFPYEGSQRVDEDQVFLLRLDAPATVASIATHAHCAVQGIGERIPVRVLSGAEREAVLAQRKALGYAYYQLLLEDRTQAYARVPDPALAQAEKSIVALQCLRRLPPGTEVRLVWRAGIAAESGIATAQDQALAFRVRPAFTARVECSRVNARAGCMPIEPIVVRFTAPVPRDTALAIRLRTAAGKVIAPEPPAAARAPMLEEVAFAAPFPALESLHVELPPRLVDDAGRALENAERFPLEMRIDEYPPLAKFAADFGILEAREGGVLAVTLRNVEATLPARQTAIPARSLRVDADAASVAIWLRRVREAGAPKGEWQWSEHEKRSVWREGTGMQSVFGAEDAPRVFVMDKPSGEKPAEVVGIPLGAPGFYVVELESRRLGAALLGRDVPRYVSTAALVTNLSVHFKWGRESSRVWVTRLHDGTPVSGAEIAVVDLCTGAQRWRGRTDRDGIAAIAESLGDPHASASCSRWSGPPLVVSAKLADDFSFALSYWSDGISPYDFGLQAGHGRDAGLWHTVFDRPLFRAGETVSMKHFLRRHTGEGIRVDGDVAHEASVTIAHLGSGQTYQSSVAFGADGVAEQRWEIPREAKLGEYSVQVQEGTVERETGRFRVEEFRLPTMRATVQGPPAALVRPRSVDLDLYVAYLSGGGASGLPVKLRSVIEPLHVHFPEYPDFQFGGAPVREGVVELGEGEDEGLRNDVAKAQVMPLTLDAQGGRRATLPVPEQIPAPARLTAELEYADANGEILTAVGRVRLLPSALTLGIRRENWVASSEQLRFQVLALDEKGAPAARRKVSVRLYQSSAYSYRKRLIGGFYAYETVRETTRLPATCEGVSDRRGILVCEVAPGVSGEVVLRAEAQDAGGHLAGATASIWVAGEDDWWFGGTTADRMDVLPEQKEYEAGDSARFQVRMPFRSATALVTVEREGVLRSYVRRLRGRSPVIEVPIENAFAPNVYVSVLAVRGRVGRTDRAAVKAGELTGIVDLNRPAYRLGIAEVRVGWKPHRLQVSVIPERETWRVREQAQVRVRVETDDGRPLPKDAEIALAAVDEALLDLAPNGSWRMLEAMMRERGIEVHTSTAQMQVIGKRHYGRKAVPHGGGGGREQARELFDSLLLWQPRVRLDAQGEARITVPLNDSLTSFRIAAVAHAGEDRFGTGSATITTTQDLMLLSGLPPLVREGDRYAATFTVRNASRRALRVRVAPQLIEAKQPLDERLVDLPAGESRDVVWAVVAPVGATEMRWDVTASAVDGEARDRLTLANRVIAAHPVRTWQATLAQLDAPFSLTAQRPKDSVPGRGGVEITLRAKLGDGLEGVREYMSWYPYSCLEQGLSRAVALRDRAMWDAWMRRLPAYTDRDGLLRYFPSEHLPGEDVLTSYVLAIAHEAGWEIPAADREGLVRALTAFVEGRIVRRSALPTADLTVRKLAAIDALARYGAANPRHLDSLTIEPNRWPTSAVIDWHGILSRVKKIPRTAERRREAETILRSRLNFQGTTMGFSTERNDALWWLMISTDSNAVRMLLAVLNEPSWKPDAPRLVRGALGRQQRGHWNTTTANAWGVLAMEKFSAAFEATPVTGKSVARYGGASRSVQWSGAPPKEPERAVSFQWAQGAQRLDVTHDGTGKPWVMVRTTAAIPLREPFSSGFKVRRTLSPVEQRVPGKWSRGDVVRVRLELEAQSDMTWVVVDDPVPGGATILGSGLGGRSELLTRDESRDGWAWSAFEERKFEAFRAYYRYVPKGEWTVEYTVRLNNPGTFELPATRVEAMYAPEMLGESPNPDLTVEASP